MRGFSSEKVAINISFPGGLYSTNSSGAMINNTVSIVVEYQLVEKNSDATSGPVQFLQYNKTAATNDAIRDKIEIPVADGYRLRFRLLRIDAKSNSLSSYSTCQVEQIQSYIRQTGESVYGDCTLIAMTIKAGASTSSGSSNKITVKTQSRQAAPWNTAGTATDDSRNAVYDMLTNTSYGAAMPAAAIDTAMLSTIVGEFNGVLDSQTTTWAALRSVLAASFTYPSTIGDMVTFVQDVARDRSTVFSQANVIGSPKFGWQIDDLKDYDGYEVKWRDPDDWSENYARFPVDCFNPESVDLIGCTSETIAEAHAQKLWNKKQYQIETLSFDTEMEGFIPVYGQRVGFADVKFTQSESGYVDAALSLTSFWSNVDLFTTGPAWCVVRSALNQSSAVIPCTVSGRTVTLSTAPTFALESGIMFSIGEAADFVTDWVIESVTDKGEGKTTVNLINYDMRAL